MHMEPSSRRGESGTSIDFDESIAPQDIRQAPRAAKFFSSRKKLRTRGGAAAGSASDLLVGRLVQGCALQEPTFSSSPLSHVHCLSQPVRLSGSLGCEAGSILPLTSGIVQAHVALGRHRLSDSNLQQFHRGPPCRLDTTRSESECNTAVSPQRVFRLARATASRGDPAWSEGGR